jgi:hypothetical protein
MLAPVQYAALALRTSFALRGVELTYGTEVDHWDHCVSLQDGLLGEGAGQKAIQRSEELYGPYIGAVYDLQPLMHKKDKLEWTSDHENYYASALRFLNPLVRWALAFESWGREQRQLFPSISGWVEKLIYAGLGFLAGRYWT